MEVAVLAMFGFGALYVSSFADSTKIKNELVAPTSRWGVVRWARNREKKKEDSDGLVIAARDGDDEV